MTRPPLFFWVLPPVAAVAGFLLAPKDAREAQTPKSQITPTSSPASDPSGPRAPQGTIENTSNVPFADVVSRAKSRPDLLVAAADRFASLKPHEFGRELQEILRLPANTREPMLLPLLFQSWVRADLPGAVAGLDLIPHRKTRDSLAVYVSRAWARKDLDAAREWAAKNLSQIPLMGFNQYADTLANPGGGNPGQTSSNPTGTLQEALSEPDLKSRDRKISALIRARAKSDPSAAARLLVDIPKEVRNSAAFHRD